jgi:hypothetical protein
VTFWPEGVMRWSLNSRRCTSPKRINSAPVEASNSRVTVTLI